MEALCDTFGKSLYNNPVSPFRSAFLDGVREHLEALGVDLISDLVYGGAPLGVPRADDFPMIGHLTAERVAQFAGLFEGKDLSTPTKALSAEGADRGGTIEASEMFRDWVQQALASKQGLVAFLY